jgi:hypothetical protein
MLKRYGEKALEESTARVDELATAGDDGGVAVWCGSRMASGNSPTQRPPARSTDLSYRWRGRPDASPDSSNRVLSILMTLVGRPAVLAFSG